MTIFEAAIFGLVFGSFANAAMERIPRRASLTDRSRCNGCGRTLRALDLVPLVSYVMLRGRCRACLEPIGMRTPAVEAGTGIAFAAAFFTLPPAGAVAACAVFVVLTIGAGALIERRTASQ
jgi:prepilin signal peptidase PulO-like enzyme (type II secretory pathway)